MREVYTQICHEQTLTYLWQPMEEAQAAWPADNPLDDVPAPFEA